MICLKAIQTTLYPTKNAVFQTSRWSRKRNCSIPCPSKPKDGDSEAPPPEGDTRNQDLLARIAMLQTQKVRLTDYLDERSAYLTQFAEEANAEIDKIGEDAVKGLEDAESRIMDNLESSMRGLEELAELNRQEIEMQDRKLEEFEDEIDDSRNEGMFFKSLGQSKPLEDKANAKEEAEKIKDVTKASAGSKTRRNVYLALMGLVAAGVVEGVISSTLDGKKIAAFGLILVGLLAQYVYEQGLISEMEKTGKHETKEERTK
uniref:Uncharacterized protein n=1 Tax=Kalanchoe fedtschenkoi TaxID=63787 RepID=A0A7N0U880_KALFE